MVSDQSGTKLNFVFISGQLSTVADQLSVTSWRQQLLKPCRDQNQSLFIFCACSKDSS